jgi:hypothetical protein
VHGPEVRQSRELRGGRRGGRFKLLGVARSLAGVRPVVPSLLLVAFDDLRVSNAGGFRVEASLAQRAPLAQQVPALVE